MTLLQADGGTGKSTAALQLGVATVLGKPWLGRTPRRGPAIYLSCEDDVAELHRRLNETCIMYDAGLEDLHDLHIWPLADDDAVLGEPGARGQGIVATPLWSKVQALALDVRPALIVLDSLADVFGGDEIKRVQVRQFIGQLRRLAIATEAAVLVLAHPSQAGISTGSGTSGSTGWSNSVRSRLYMEELKTEAGSAADPDLRTLSRKKANYARGGFQPLQLRRRIGGYVLDDDGHGSAPGAAAAEARMDRIFIDLLAAYAAQKRPVSPTPCPTYAPTVFARDDRAKGYTKAGFADAMNRLLHQRRIEVVTVGPPSRERQHLIIVEGVA